MGRRQLPIFHRDGARNGLSSAVSVLPADTSRATTAPPPKAQGHAAPATVLAVNELTVSHGPHAVVENVSFTLSSGSILAVVGPNGGGKTSLLRAILGLEGSRGHVRVAGLSPIQAQRRGHVLGYVPQRPAVPGALPVSVRQAVRLALPRGAAPEAADDLLREVMGRAADRLMETPTHALSGGQLQQVFLARALAGEPALLVLDEPTVGLDKAATARLVDVLLARRTAGMAMLLATHDHPTAMRLSDHLIFLDRQIRYEGAADAVPPHLDCQLCHHA